MTKNKKRKTLKLKNNNNVIKIKIVKRDFWPEQKKYSSNYLCQRNFVKKLQN